MSKGHHQMNISAIISDNTVSSTMPSKETEWSTHSEKTKVREDEKDSSKKKRNLEKVWYKCARCHQAFDDRATLMTHCTSFCFVFHLVLKGNSKGIPKSTEKHESTSSNIRNDGDQGSVESQQSSMVRVDNVSSQVTKISREVKTPGICPICNKQLSNELLSRHIRIHTGELPHACSKCSLTFSQRCSLTRHLLTHKKGEKLLDCNQCDNRYRSVRDLNRHLKLHDVTGDVAKEVLLKCRVCFLEYRTKRGLREHEKTHGPLSKDFGDSDSDGTELLTIAKTKKKTASAAELPQRRRKRRRTTVKSYAEETSTSSSDEENFPPKNKRDRNRRRNSIESDDDSETGEFILSKPVEKNPSNTENSQKEVVEDMENNSARDDHEISSPDDQHEQCNRYSLLDSSVKDNDKEKDNSSREVGNSISNQIPLSDCKGPLRNPLTEAQLSNSCHPNNANTSTSGSSPPLDDNSENLISNTSETADNPNYLTSISTSLTKSSGNTETSTYPMIKCNVCSLSYERTVQGYHNHVAAHHSFGKDDSHQSAAKKITKRGPPLPNTLGGSSKENDVTKEDMSPVLEKSSERNKHNPVPTPKSQKKTKLRPVKRKPAEIESSSEEELSYETDVTSEPSTDASSLCMDSEFDSESTYQSDEEPELTDQSHIERPAEEEASSILHDITNVPNELNVKDTGKMQVLHNDITQDGPQFTSNVNVGDHVKRKIAKIVLVKLNLKEIEEFGCTIPKIEETDDTLDRHDQIQSNVNETPTFENVEECKPDVTALQGDGNSISCNVKTMNEHRDIAQTSENAVRDLRDPNNFDDVRVRNGGGSFGVISETSATHPCQTPVSIFLKHETDANKIASVCQSPGAMFDHSITEFSSQVRSDLTRTTESINGGVDKNISLQRNSLDIDTIELSDNHFCYRPKIEPVSENEVDQSTEQQRGLSNSNNSSSCSDVKTEPFDEVDRSPNDDMPQFDLPEAETVRLQDYRSDIRLKTEQLSNDDDTQINLHQSFGFNEDCTSSAQISAGHSQSDLGARARNHEGFPNPLDYRPTVTVPDFRWYGRMLSVSETFAVGNTGQSVRPNFERVIMQEDHNHQSTSCMFQGQPVTFNGNSDRNSYGNSYGNTGHMTNTYTNTFQLQSMFPMQFN